VLPLPRLARASALLASLAIALVGVVAGAVRLLPWLLDPSVPWRVAAPFARGLGSVAVEAALLVGWPVGWALACCRFVESGEARVLLTLGESPASTVRRLAPQGALLAIALGAVALVYGNDASAPGRVATELVAQARAACAQVQAPTTYAIPFTDMTWLCAPDREPRLVGTAPGGLAGAVLTARNARIAGDFRALELDGAQVLLAPRQPGLRRCRFTAWPRGRPRRRCRRGFARSCSRSRRGRSRRWRRTACFFARRAAAWARSCWARRGRWWRWACCGCSSAPTLAPRRSRSSPRPPRSRARP
jgi:hypothetical protein